MLDVLLDLCSQQPFALSVYLDPFEKANLTCPMEIFVEVVSCFCKGVICNNYNILLISTYVYTKVVRSCI